MDVLQHTGEVRKVFGQNTSHFSDFCPNRQSKVFWESSALVVIVVGTRNVSILCRYCSRGIYFVIVRWLRRRNKLLANRGGSWICHLCCWSSILLSEIIEPYYRVTRSILIRLISQVLHFKNKD